MAGGFWKLFLHEICRLLFISYSTLFPTFVENSQRNMPVSLSATQRNRRKKSLRRQGTLHSDPVLLSAAYRHSATLRRTGIATDPSPSTLRGGGATPGCSEQPKRVTCSHFGCSRSPSQWSSPTALPLCFLLICIPRTTVGGDALLGWPAVNAGGGAASGVGALTAGAWAPPLSLGQGWNIPVVGKETGENPQIIPTQSYEQTKTASPLARRNRVAPSILADRLAHERRHFELLFVELGGVAGE